MTPRRALPDRSAGADGEVIRRVLGGDREAFRVLVERYQGRAQALALRVLRDEEMARDAVQEAFLKAYIALDRFQGRSSFYTWFYRLLMNQCLDARRRDRSERHVAYEEGGVSEALREGVEAGSSWASEGAAAPALRRQLGQRIGEAIDRLPEGARETLWLREVEELSYAEIARILDVPKGTVMSRLHNARQRLRELLREAGVVPAGGGSSGCGGEGKA